MMSRQKKVQNQLFYSAINLEQRVRKDHILRKVKSHIDFDFIYNEVKDTYGFNGNESVPPPVILKMLLQRKLATVARLKKSVPAQKPGALSSVMSDKMILI